MGARKHHGPRRITIPFSLRKASSIIAWPICRRPIARTATQALTNVTYRFIELLADNGLEEACRKQPALLGGINVMDGRITHKAVADAHGMKLEKALSSLKT